ncbi:MAG: sensor histidine kinase [Microcoleaceae cyanobacterium]
MLNISLSDRYLADSHLLYKELEELRRENASLKALIQGKQSSSLGMLPSDLREISDYESQFHGILQQLSQDSAVVERKSVEFVVQDVLHIANAAAQAKSSFLANMSHELRTPLNAIIGYSSILLEEITALRLNDLLPDIQIIHEEGQRLLQLINNILDLAKVESGEMPLNLETFDLETLVELIVAQFDSQAVESGNQLNVIFGDTLSMVRTDAGKLRQILSHLLDNALKFTHRGQVSLEVTRECIENADWICCKVSDTGIGISSEHQHYLFEPFSQVDSSMTRQYEGTGLGLAICRQFCQMLGGNIFVASEPGVGSTFTVYIKANMVGD